MIKSALCEQVTLSRSWLLFGKVINYLFSHPIPTTTALLAVAGFAYFRWFRRRRRLALIVGAGLIVVFLTVGSPIGEALGSHLLARFVPPDSGEKAQAIVVLGRGLENNTLRADEAARLWHGQRAPLIFASGRVDAPMIGGRVKQQGVPDTAFAKEPCSLSTDQNAEFTAAILLPQDIQKIILVTDSFHMLRSLLTFKSFGFEVIPHTTPLATLTQAKKSRFLATREAAGALSYGLMGRYFSRKVPAETMIEAQKLVQQLEQHNLKNGQK